MGLEVISLTITPAASYDLVQLADVHAYQGIPPTDTTQDAFIAGAISRVSAAIQTYCGRNFAVEGRSDTFYPERSDYPWQLPGNIRKLNLTSWPVINVGSVQIFFDQASPQTLNTTQDFLIDPARGQLVRMDATLNIPSAWDTVQTVVQYTAGYAPIPLDIQDACLRMISSSMKGRGRDPMLKAIEQAGVRQEYWVDASGNKGNFPPDITEVLDFYRVPVAR